MGRVRLLSLGMALALVVAAGAGAEVYRWTDEKGTVHATTDPGQVPEQFRSQIKKGGLTPRGKLSSNGGAPASPAAAPAPVQDPTAQTPVSATPSQGTR
jgi:Domain of unknown function (DUF4124)